MGGRVGFEHNCKAAATCTCSMHVQQASMLPHQLGSVAALAAQACNCIVRAPTCGEARGGAGGRQGDRSSEQQREPACPSASLSWSMLPC